MTLPDQTKPHRGLLWSLVLLMVLFWTLNPIVGKVALRHLPPLLLTGLRTTLAGLTIFAIFLWRERKRVRLTKGDLAHLVAIGVGGQFLNQVLFILGLDRTSVSHTAFIFSTVPISVLVLAAARKQEAITSSKLVGMAVCVAGVLWLSSDKAGGEATVAGDALLALATLAFASFTVFGKEARNRHGPVTINMVAYCGGALVMQPVIWGVYRDFSLGAVPLEAWLAIVYMAIFPAVLGYVIYYWALGYTSASRLAVLQYLQPPLATALSAVLLGESVTWTLAFAGAMVLTGVVLTERARVR